MREIIVDNFAGGGGASTGVDRDCIMHGLPTDIAEFLGPEPYYLEWPEVDNPDYSYLSRICDAVKAAFSQQKEAA